MGLETFIERQGELFKIRRGNEVSEAKGLRNRDSGRREYIGFYPGTDIQAGDELTGTASGNVHSVSSVERQLMNGEVFQVKAFIDDRSNVSASSIHVGSMVNSAIQQGSPGASQTVTVSQQQHDSAAELIEAILQALETLDLEPQQREQLSTDIVTAQAQLESPKPRWTIIGECFRGIKDTLDTVAASASAGAGAALASGLADKFGEFLSKLAGG